MGESEHDLDETQTGQDHLENAYEASLNEPIPTLTKPTDVYAFSMVVLDVSNHCCIMLKSSSFSRSRFFF